MPKWNRKSLYPVETVAVAIFVMVVGVFEIALGAGWLWKKAEEIPLFIQLLLYVVGLLMIASSAYLIGNELMLEATPPLKTTSEGLYLPTSRSRFRKEIKQRYVLRSEIASLTVHERGYGLEVIIVMKSGKRIKFLCPMDRREELGRFWPQVRT